VIDPYSRLDVRRSTYLFFCSASVVAVLIVVGTIMDVPAVDNWLTDAETHTWGRLLVYALLLCFFISAMTLWSSAVWYAQVSPDVMLPRGPLVAILILTNFVGGFFYYWLAVHWRPGTERIRHMKRPLFPAQPSN